MTVTLTKPASWTPPDFGLARPVAVPGAVVAAAPNTGTLGVTTVMSTAAGATCTAPRGHRAAAGDGSGLMVTDVASTHQVSQRQPPSLSQHQHQQPPPARSTCSVTDIVPARWAAPEVLAGGPPTEAGDVWSFGVTCWEVFANGAEPYASLSNAQVLMALRSGYRLDRPRGCPLELWELILRCWSEDPAARPTFAYIAETLRTWREAYVQRRTNVMDADRGGPAIAGSSAADGVTVAGGSAPVVAAVAAFGLHAVGGSGSSGPGVSSASGAATDPAGGSGGWRTLPTVGAVSMGMGIDARRGRAAGLYSRSPSAICGGLIGGNGTSVRGSGSGGLGVLLPSGHAAGPGQGHGGPSAGPMSTHMSFDIAEPPITPAYTSGSSIGVTSVVLQPEHMQQLGGTMGSGLARSSILEMQQQSSGEGGGRRNGGQAPPSSPSRRRAAAGGRTLAGVGLVLTTTANPPGRGGGSGAATSATTEGLAVAGAVAIAAAARTLASSSQSSVPHTSSGNGRSSAGARSSAGTRSSAGAVAGGFLDVRGERPHRLQRTGITAENVRLATPQAQLPSVVMSPEGGAAVGGGAAAVPVAFGFPVDSAAVDVAVAALRGRTSIFPAAPQVLEQQHQMTLTGSVSSGRTQSTVTGASIFNDSQQGRGGGASAGDASGSGSNPLASFSSGGAVPQRSGRATGEATTTDAMVTAAAVEASMRGNNRGTADGDTATEFVSQSRGPIAARAGGGLQRSTSPYVRIGDLAVPSQLPIPSQIPMPSPASWPTGRLVQAHPSTMKNSITTAAEALETPGRSRNHTSSHGPAAATVAADGAAAAATGNLDQEALRAAGLVIPTVAATASGAPLDSDNIFLTPPLLPLPDDISLKAMIKVTASAARSGMAGEPTSSTLLAGNLDSSTGVGPVSLGLPAGLMVMASRSELFMHSQGDSSSGQQTAGSLLRGSSYRAAVSGDGGTSPGVLPVMMGLATAPPPPPYSGSGTAVETAGSLGDEMMRAGGAIAQPVGSALDTAVAVRTDDNISGIIIASLPGNSTSSGTNWTPEVLATMSEGVPQLGNSSGTTAGSVTAALHGAVQQQLPPPPQPQQQLQLQTEFPQPAEELEHEEQQLPQHPQQLQHAQVRMGLILGPPRARRGSNGTRASTSPRCSGPTADPSSGGASGASSRNVIPSRLLRTAPALRMPSPSLRGSRTGGGLDGVDSRTNRDAALSPPTSVHSARTPESLHSTWSARSVWLEHTREPAPPDLSVGGSPVAPLQWQGSAGRYPLSSPVSQVPSRLLVPEGPAVAEWGRGEEDAVAGGRNLNTRSAVSIMEAPVSITVADTVFNIESSAAVGGEAPALGLVQFGNSAGLARGLHTTLATYEEEHRRAVGSQGGMVKGSGIGRVASSGFLSRAGASATASTISAAPMNRVGDSPGSSTIYGQVAAASSSRGYAPRRVPSWGATAAATAAVLSEGSLQTMSRAAMWGARVEPGTSRQQGVSNPAVAAITRRPSIGTGLVLAEPIPGAPSVTGESCGLSPGELRMSLGLRSSPDEVVAERQAIFDYLQTRQFEELQNERDW
ncbi:hypothetical protein Vafri_17176 [Volvox africanus]|uniref:Protein kinase domain-containing protein n=1 Tax=Volvox africanus TaxID=51714 RepID=A0A8J4F763_9CHLO|nr:hypothetical protein Vafri_17176 [Volvox africanus]